MAKNLYEDYKISEKLFHWQSQSGTSLESEIGHRYINHLRSGNRIVLFGRENKKKDGVASPYVYLEGWSMRDIKGQCKALNYLKQL